MLMKKILKKRKTFIVVEIILLILYPVIWFLFAVFVPLPEYPSSIRSNGCGDIGSMIYSLFFLIGHIVWIFLILVMDKVVARLTKDTRPTPPPLFIIVISGSLILFTIWLILLFSGSLRGYIC